MKFILTTDQGTFTSVPAEVMSRMMDYLLVSGTLLQYIENTEFEDKVLESMIKVNIATYNDLYVAINKKLTKSENVGNIDIVEEDKEEITETETDDNVIQFPFGKK